MHPYSSMILFFGVNEIQTKGKWKEEVDRAYSGSATTAQVREVKK